MIFTKTKFYKSHKAPIDFGKNFKDGKRIFGDNKTWIGFISMIIFCTFFQLICGILCNLFDLNNYNELYSIYDNTIYFNIIFGLSTGIIYMLSELPNSFIKRRLDIKCGKTDKGLKGIVFFVIDQIDSLVGVMFLLYLLSDISFLKFLFYIFVGAFTHIAVNLTLLLLKVRKNL